MKYTIKSENFTLGKKGEVVDAKALSAFNIDALIEANHIAKESASKEKQTEGDAE